MEATVKALPELTELPLPGVPTTRIVVPYVPGLAFEMCKLNLENQLITAEYRLMKGEGSDYPNLFRELWSDGEPFILVEHDILPHPGSLLRMAACLHPWCCHYYQVNGTIQGWLGCTKFVPAELGENPLPDYLNTWQFDVPVTVELWERGTQRHVHGPPVVHLNDYRVGE